jgi:hypothetical protein
MQQRKSLPGLRGLVANRPPAEARPWRTSLSWHRSNVILVTPTLPEGRLMAMKYGTVALQACEALRLPWVCEYVYVHVQGYSTSLLIL